MEVGTRHMSSAQKPVCAYTCAYSHVAVRRGCVGTVGMCRCVGTVGVYKVGGRHMMSAQEGVCAHRHNVLDRCVGKHVCLVECLVENSAHTCYRGGHAL